MIKAYLREEKPYSFTVISSLYITFLITSHLLTAKEFINPLPLMVGESNSVYYLTFPLLYILAQLVLEKYSKTDYVFLMLVGVIAKCVMWFLQTVSVTLTPDPSWVVSENAYSYHSLEEYQKAYLMVFGTLPFLAASSTISYMISTYLQYMCFKLNRGSKRRYVFLRYMLTIALVLLARELIFYHCCWFIQPLFFSYLGIFKMATARFLYNCSYILTLYPLYYLAWTYLKGSDRFCSSN